MGPQVRHTGGAALPVVEHVPVRIGADERAALHDLARVLLTEEPTLNAIEPFGPGVSQGLGPWPSLVVEDHSAITLFDVLGDVAYSYRALLLAGEGDLIAIGVSRSMAFETYCRDILGLGKVEILQPAPAEIPKALALACAGDPDFIERAAERARLAGGLNVIPYMGTGGVWRLAERIAAEARVEVRVAAPPPRLVRRVNDKAWFARRVVQVLGPRALPPAIEAFSLAALTGHVARLARSYPGLAVKLTDSASSAGNLILNSEDVRRATLHALHEDLDRTLRGVGWPGGFPLLVTAWEEPVLASPSVQLWIPHASAGPPVVEGVFDQMTFGPRRVFGGAAPSDLAPAWHARLAEEAVRLACVFQDLGYFGRCSFDSILIGADEDTAELHWVECNGRWGGVSLPMTLANRLIGDWAKRALVIIDRGNLQGQPRDLSALLSEWQDELYRPGRRETGTVILSPGRLVLGTGFELMVLGETHEAARAQAEALAARLISEAERR